MKRILATAFLGIVILTTGSLSVKKFEINKHKHEEIKEVYFHANNLERQLYN